MTGGLGLIPDETVSQDVAQKMVYAGVHARSFEESSGFCRELVELDIQGRRIGRFVRNIGTERVEQRDLETEAWRLGFMHAEKGAFVGDGSEANWGVWRAYFPRFTPIIDFVHAICYLYQAIMQNLPVDEGWDLYCRMAQMLWSGEPAEVLDGLLGLQQKVGLPNPDEPESSPLNHLAAAIRYLKNQQSRMRYAEYRQAGLPITSCHMESTIKQINRRVKGSEKFWSHDGGEAILQLVADHLSDHSPMERFWTRRENQANGVRCHR